MHFYRGDPSRPCEFDIFESFDGFKIFSCRDLEKILAKEPGMFELDTNDTDQFAKIFGTLMGTHMYKQIPISPLHYQQMDVVTFHQMRIEKFLINVSCD